jgi:hypothetical protein
MGAAALAAVGLSVACTGDDPVFSGTDLDGAANDAEAGAIGSSCVADLMSDTLHCGRCDRSCLGSACVDGGCQPVVLFGRDGGGPPITALDVAGDRIYWATDEPGIRAELRSCTLPACDATAKTLAYSGDGGYFAKETVTSGIAADATHVYFTNYFLSRVYRCPREGCPDGGQPELFGSATGSPDQVTLDDTTVFWANSGSGDSIEACPKSGCGTVPRTLTSNQLDAGRVLFPTFVIDGQFIYFQSYARAGTFQEIALEGAPGIYRVEKSAQGVMPTTVARKLDQPQHLAVAGNSLFFTDLGAVDAASPLTSGRIDKTALGALVTTVADKLPKPTSLLVDGPSMYFVGSADGTVRRCSIANCIASVIIAADQADPSELRQDAVSLYWYNASSSQIVRLAK